MAELNSTIVKGNLSTTGNIYENGTRVLTSAVASASVSNNTLTLTPSSGSAITCDIIKTISTEYTRITSLTTGWYRLTHTSPKLYYNGTSSTDSISVFPQFLTASTNSWGILLKVNHYTEVTDISEETWSWEIQYKNQLLYGSTTTTGGTHNEISLMSPTNYYPSRSYSSGLQISTSQGVTDTCALYVPYATTSQKGVVSVSTNSGLSVSSGALSVNFGTAYSAVPRGSHQHCWQDDLGAPQRKTGVDTFINNFFSYCDDNLDMDNTNAVRGFFLMSLLNAGMPWDVYQINFYTDPYEATVFAYNYMTSMSLTMSIEAKSSEITCVIRQPGSAPTTSYFDAGDTNAVFDYWFIRSVTSN